ncbi:hypothetical protein [Bradyrhizobium sp. F1.13.3]|uniref:hypothetical protein n=1 Tax=Bradyrhizobium sp. F1.13.3 TaxID=3156351 RepID=UPI003390844C
MPSDTSKGGFAEIKGILPSELILKATRLGEMRETGVRGVLVYSRHRCGHHAEISADGWADDVRLSDIEPRFVCQRCGRRGAEMRAELRTC